MLRAERVFYGLRQDRSRAFEAGLISFLLAEPQEGEAEAILRLHPRERILRRRMPLHDLAI
jgi:hypothetical protein